MGMDFDEHVIARLTDDFGGHPFLIRQVCSEIHKRSSQQRPLKVDKALYNIIVSSLSNSFGQYLSMIIEVLREYYPDEYEMLKMLAIGDAETFSGLAKQGAFYTVSDH
jgi:hypothetical protein